MYKYVPSLGMQKKRVLEIQELSSTQFCYEWFRLGFTGVGLPSLARRARVPADSATLYSMIACWRLKSDLGGGVTPNSLHNTGGVISKCYVSLHRGEGVKND